MAQFDGQVVLITGASRGIGAAAARAFAAEGAHVVVSARSFDALDALVAEIKAEGGAATAVACDVSDYQQVTTMVEAARAITGRLDVYIGNAGMIEPISRLEDSDPEAWTRTFRINAEGIYYGLRAVMPAMRAQGGGTIINISSGAAHNALEGWSHYCASKAAAAMLTEAAHKAAGDTLRVMGLSPGTVATQMQREIAASGINPVSQIAWENHIPADWPAKALMWMCTAAADGYLGQEVKLRDEEVRRAIGLV